MEAEETHESLYEILEKPDCSRCRSCRHLDQKHDITVASGALKALEASQRNIAPSWNHKQPMGSKSLDVSDAVVFSAKRCLTELNVAEARPADGYESVLEVASRRW